MVIRYGDLVRFTICIEAGSLPDLRRRRLGQFARRWRMVQKAHAKEGLSK